jgi:hypothetical protein
MSKTFDLAIAKASALPEPAQEWIGGLLLERIDALSELRAAIDIGVAELDAGLGASLDIEEVVLDARVDRIAPCQDKGDYPPRGCALSQTPPKKR